MASHGSSMGKIAPFANSRASSCYYSAKKIHEHNNSTGYNEARRGEQYETMSVLVVAPTRNENYFHAWIWECHDALTLLCSPAKCKHPRCTINIIVQLFSYLEQGEYWDSYFVCRHGH